MKDTLHSPPFIAERLKAFIEQRRETLVSLSDAIWEVPELRYEEFVSSGLVRDALKTEGFEVTENLCDIATAFVGKWGNSGPVIAFLGEYDALPGLSQKAGVAEYCPVEEGGNGHGCGHNLLGVGTLAAALAARDYLRENNLEGTVYYYGCPAEEGGGGKVRMAEGGAFEGVDCVFSWHPSDVFIVPTRSNLATTSMEFRFIGVTSHAASNPHSGRSALDAVELMNVGANYLREHIPPQMRLHYAITDSGGKAPNVVQGKATVRYQLRAPEVRLIEEVLPRLNDVAKGAALMTGTKVEREILVSYRNFIPNKTMLRRLFNHQQVIGLPEFTSADLEFAREIQKSIPRENIDHHRVEGVRGKVLADIMFPWVEEMGLHWASTDVGDVSWRVPTVEYRSATWAVGTVAHTWQTTAQGKCAYAHKGMLHAGHVLAATAIDMILNPELIEQAKVEHRARVEAGS